MTIAICPVCGRTDQVEKVSSLYLAGIGQSRSARLAGLSPDISLAFDLSADELQTLSQRLQPPASPRRTPYSRPIHPDLMIAVYSGIMLIFLWGIWNSQPVWFWPALIALAVFYGAYFGFRSHILARFERQQADQQASEQRVKRGIERWMKLYYCARDDGVFEPGSDALVPADQMPGLLLRE